MIFYSLLNGLNVSMEDERYSDFIVLLLITFVGVFITKFAGILITTVHFQKNV